MAFVRDFRDMAMRFGRLDGRCVGNGGFCAIEGMENPVVRALGYARTTARRRRYPLLHHVPLAAEPPFEAVEGHEDSKAEPVVPDWADADDF